MAKLLFSQINGVVVITKNSSIMLGAMTFEDKQYYWPILQPQLEQLSDPLGELPLGA